MVAPIHHSFSIDGQEAYRSDQSTGYPLKNILATAAKYGKRGAGLAGSHRAICRPICLVVDSGTSESKVNMSDKSKILLHASRFQVVVREQQLADGTTKRRQIVIHPGAVTVIPLLAGNRVCLIRNYRVSVEKALIELPAGTIDGGEAPHVTAARELQEETGYSAGRWRELPAFYMSPGILNERMHLFIAEDLTEGATGREAGEEIDNLIVPWPKAVEMALSGEIEDAKSLVGILRWELLRLQGLQ